MNEERRKSERRVPPAVVEFAVKERQQLLEKIADQAREIERLKAGQESLILVRDDYKRQAGEYRTLWSKAVVKPRPHGLVLPERDDVIRKAVGMCNRIPGSTTWNAAEYAYDEFVARLNSSPVSAGDDALTCDYCGAETEDPWHGSGMLDGAESRHIHACDGCRHMLPSVSAGVVDERAAFEVWARKHNQSLIDDDIDQPEDINLDKQAGVYIWANAESAWMAWQARAALTASAPNHGEQVRGDEYAPFNCEHAACKSLGQHHPLCAGYKLIEAEAAAPSAGSQGGDV